MESPSSFIVRKNLSFDSPNMVVTTTRRITKRTSMRLSFESVQDSPICYSKQINECSTDSGFSEQVEDEISQATNLDESFSFKSITNDSSFSLYDELETFDSPYVHFNQFKQTKDIIKFEETIEVKHEQVKQALDVYNQTSDRLIGDMSRGHILPILSKSRHNDLASIDNNTLVDLINGKYQDKIGKFIILDARYPYEFDGGHINGAKSGFNRDEIMDQLLNEPIQAENGKPVILIFHCEFSAERGPRLMRELRERDRSINKDDYPNLCYPEIYLLEGGYKQFYESNQQLCEPRAYVPMLQDEHRNDMKFFRKKSKSLDVETKKSRFATKSKLFF
ncbi:unnamed protein product [Brachionus calyciflorus]|uniref:M-phase inducer phosphatase n=1 Tax=Brachionus calyciflorus TaxID=104777 RepID=A0A814G814_9BILA|nr:unnamed protein product [Brachionus calyciflorus]